MGRGKNTFIKIKNNLGMKVSVIGGKIELRLMQNHLLILLSSSLDVIKIQLLFQLNQFMTKVSIITPSYNAARFIKEIQSVIVNHLIGNC